MFTFSHAGKSIIKTSPHCFVVFYFVKNRCRCCCLSTMLKLWLIGFIVKWSHEKINYLSCTTVKKVQDCLPTECREAEWLCFVEIIHEENYNKIRHLTVINIRTVHWLVYLRLFRTFQSNDRIQNSLQLIIRIAWQ